MIFQKIERLHRKLETHYAEGDREKYIAVNNVFHARDPTVPNLELP
jgi:DNA-binding GntR family transcriptional regulator